MWGWWLTTTLSYIQHNGMSQVKIKNITARCKHMGPQYMLLHSGSSVLLLKKKNTQMPVHNIVKCTSSQSVWLLIHKTSRNFTTDNLLLADCHLFRVMYMWTRALLLPHTFSKTAIKYARLIAFLHLIGQHGYAFLFCLTETQETERNHRICITFWSTCINRQLSTLGHQGSFFCPSSLILLTASFPGSQDNICVIIFFTI